MKVTNEEIRENKIRDIRYTNKNPEMKMDCACSDSLPRTALTWAPEVKRKRGV
mgnify:FL=1